MRKPNHEKIGTRFAGTADKFSLWKSREKDSDAVRDQKGGKAGYLKNMADTIEQTKKF